MDNINGRAAVLARQRIAAHLRAAGYARAADRVAAGGDPTRQECVEPDGQMPQAARRLAAAAAAARQAGLQTVADRLDFAVVAATDQVGWAETDDLGGGGDERGGGRGGGLAPPPPDGGHGGGAPAVLADLEVADRDPGLFRASVAFTDRQGNPADPTLRDRLGVAVLDRLLDAEVGVAETPLGPVVPEADEDDTLGFWLLPEGRLEFESALAEPVRLPDGTVGHAALDDAVWHRRSAHPDGQLTRLTVEAESLLGLHPPELWALIPPIVEGNLGKVLLRDNEGRVADRQMTVIDSRRCLISYRCDEAAAAIGRRSLGPPAHIRTRADAHRSRWPTARTGLPRHDRDRSLPQAGARRLRLTGPDRRPAHTGSMRAGRPT